MRRLPAVLLLFICSPFLTTPLAAGLANQQDDKEKENWPVDDSYGFPVWVATNEVGPRSNDRRIYLLIDDQHFTRDNLQKVFTGLAAKYPESHPLWIYAYSDREALKRLRAYNQGGDFVDFLPTPEGRRAQRNWYLRLGMWEGRRDYHWANYYRLDVRETFTYNPDPDKGISLTVNLKHPTPEYGGVPTTDLITAIEYGDLEKVQAAIGAGADVNKNSKYGAPPLMMAVSRGQYEIVKSLLKAGASVNQRLNAGISEGETALMTAAHKGDAEMIRLLLDAGADVNAHNDGTKYSDAETPLIMASLNGYERAVHALIHGGARIDDRNRFGETALMVAALAGFSKVVRILLDNGAEVNAHDSNGTSILMLAGNNGEVAAMLVQAGSDVKESNREGMTALMVAIAEYQEAKVKVLIDNGAGRESIKACQLWMTTNLPKDKYQRDFRLEEGYRILSTIYAKLGQKSEAVETSLQAIRELGDQAHLRANLGLIYLAVGDKVSAIEQYKILQERALKATDESTVRLYQRWADTLKKSIEQKFR